MRSVRMHIASSLLMAICMAATAGHPRSGSAAQTDEDTLALPEPKFADDAVAMLNSKIDAARCSSGTGAATSSGTTAATSSGTTTVSSATVISLLPPGDRQGVSADDSDPQGTDPAAAAPSDDSHAARIAALKARLRERMGGDADPPPEEPPLPPPPGPMIGLRQPQCLQNLGISLSGWLESGMTFNGDHPANGFNGPVDMNDLDSEFQMNQLWMTLERPVTTGNGFDVGGRIDLSYGTDWRWNVNNGLENRIDGLDDQTYGLMLPQFYLDAAYNELKVDLGHFYSGFDFESVPAPANFFYSHSYCYTYAVPHELTGMNADYQLDGNWSVQGGVHRGWNQFEDVNHAIDFLGGIRWQSADRRTTVSYSLTDGPQDPAGQQNRFVYSLVVQEKLGPRSQYILVHDLGVEDNAPIAGRQAQWYGLNQYYVYSLSSTLAACLRAEWFRDQDGVIVDGPGTVPGVRAWSGGGFAGNFYEVTAGLNWRPCQNVIFRPEVRYDWYDGGVGTSSLAGQAGLPFNDGRSGTQFLTAADFIVQF